MKCGLSPDLTTCAVGLVWGVCVGGGGVEVVDGLGVLVRVCIQQTTVTV
jgi:hypothetical protein